MAYDATKTARELEREHAQQQQRIREMLNAPWCRRQGGGPVPRHPSQYALVGFEVRNLTHARVAWYGPKDCPIWDRLTDTQRNALAKRRLTDARQVQTAHPGKLKDTDSYCAMLKRFAAEAPAAQAPAPPKVKRERKPRTPKPEALAPDPAPPTQPVSEQPVYTAPVDDPPVSEQQPAPAYEPRTRGERAYWADLVLCPNYDDGTPRRMWASLSDAERQGWERNPSVRNYGA